MTTQLNKIFSTIQVKTVQSLNHFYEKLIKSQQHFKAQTPKPRQKTLKSEESLSKQIAFDQKQLFKKKKALLDELKLVDNQLKKVSLQKSHIKKRIETEMDEEKLYEKAAELVTKMNKRRQQILDKKNKERWKIEQNVRETLRYIEEKKISQQVQKQQKKAIILKKIQDRKNKSIIRDKFNKKANTIINDLKNYRISLPVLVTLSNPQGQANQNAEHHEVIGIHQVYPVSRFLQNLKHEEMKRKRQEHVKSYDKKKIRERQQMYGDKIRGKEKDQSTVFVTN